MPVREDVVEGALLRGVAETQTEHRLRFPFAERTLVHVLERQARERPDHPWLVFDSRETLTFGQASDRVQRFAEAVLEHVGPAPRVALFLRNQIEFMPAFLGAQAAGGLSVPLNAELKGPLLETMLSRAGAQVLIVRAELLQVLEALPGLGSVELVLLCGTEDGPQVLHGVPVQRFDAFLPDRSRERRLPRTTDIGALMFTSGTSGGSKAAVCTNHYLYWFPACVADALELTDDDVLSTPLQICHVAALHNFANAALHAGITAHLKTWFSASSYWQDAAADGATFSMLMGQMASMVLRAVPEAPPHRQAFTYVLPQPVDREEFERRYRTTVVWQGWGMTEIFPHIITRHPLQDVTADTIGPAPSWVDVGVVDEDDRLLPPGTLGEMVYRPRLPFTMASGYFEDPEATSRAFRNLMFHTGDLGYYDEDGNIHFVMRNQDAIRRRGENISAVELERVVLAHPAVVDVAAYAVPAELGEHEVKLDVVGEQQIDLDELHSWLVEVLPRYMVPTYLEQRESLPKTVSQRVEKYRLMAEPLDRPTVRAYEAARRSPRS